MHYALHYYALNTEHEVRIIVCSVQYFTVNYFSVHGTWGMGHEVSRRDQSICDWPIRQASGLHLLHASPLNTNLTRPSRLLIVA